MFNYRYLLVAFSAALVIFASGLNAETEDVVAGDNGWSRDFSGHWELDYQMSDRTKEKVQSVSSRARRDAERRAELARGSGRYTEARMFNAEFFDGLGWLAEKIAQATVLDIKQEPDHIIIQRDNDYALVCDFTNMGFRPNPVGTEGCVWIEDQLIFQVALPEGLNFLHKLSIARDRSRLNIATTVMVDGVRYPITLNRVYMPYEPGEGGYDCEYTLAKKTTCTLRGKTE